jgi:hypothetical protein
MSAIIEVVKESSMVIKWRENDEIRALYYIYGKLYRKGRWVYCNLEGCKDGCCVGCELGWSIHSKIQSVTLFYEREREL